MSLPVEINQTVHGKTYTAHARAPDKTGEVFIHFEDTLEGVDIPLALVKAIVALV